MVVEIAKVHATQIANDKAIERLTLYTKFEKEQTQNQNDALTKTVDKLSEFEKQVAITVQNFEDAKSLAEKTTQTQKDHLISFTESKTQVLEKNQQALQKFDQKTEELRKTFDAEIAKVVSESSA